MWRREGYPAGAELVAGCEAFLTGRYAEYLESRQRSVSAWAWMNLLAHGTDAELISACRSLGTAEGWGRPDGAWREARSYLAGEVLDVVDEGSGPLCALQRRVLVPLEARLAADDSAGPNPGWLVTAVVDALDDVRRRQRRRQNGAEAPHDRPLST